MRNSQESSVKLCTQSRNHGINWNQSEVCNCETAKNLGIGEWIKNRKEAKADYCMEVGQNGLVNLKRGHDLLLPSTMSA